MWINSNVAARGLPAKQQRRRKNLGESPSPPPKYRCETVETQPDPPPKRRSSGQEPRAEVTGEVSCAAPSWCVGDNICGVARAEGYAKEVTGVALPQGCDDLFSGSLDCMVRVWDCRTGRCVRTVPMAEGEIGSLISTGPLVC